MKKLLVLFLVLLSCSVAFAKEKNRKYYTEEKMELVTIYTSGEVSVYKVVIDEHDYLLKDNGGIVHSESCPCRLMD